MAAAWAGDARAEDVEAILALYVNEVESGELRVVLRDGDVLVSREDLQAAGLGRFEAAEIEVDGQRLVSLESVRPRLRYVVDEEEVALRLHAPAALLPSHLIDLGAPPPDISYAARPSAFLNYAPRLAVPSAGPVTASAFSEVGVAERARLYYSSATASQADGVVRGLTSVNFDDRPRLRRLTLGDTSVSAGPIGGAVVMGGVTFARDFALDPYLFRHPTMRFTSSTELPATIDVFVDGIRVRSEPIAPGTFTLDHLRGLAGAGRVRYVVRDSLGREQVFARPYYVSPDVLAKGLEDFAVSAGLPRDAVGRESFSYLDPSFLAYYRRGLSDFLTLGGRAEGQWGRVSGGPVVATVTPLGALEVETAASVDVNGRAGVAALFAYEYLSRRFNLATSLRLLSDEYSTVSLRPEQDRSLAQATLSTSVPIGERATLAAQHTVDLHRDAPTYARVGALTQVRLGADFLLTAQLALVTLEPPASSWDGFLGVTWSPRSGFFTSAGARTTDGAAGANFQVNRPATVGEDWSMAGAVDVSTVTRASLQSHLQTRSATLSAFFDQTPDSSTLALEPAGSLVWVKDGGFFLSRPLYDGFALVRVPEVEGVRVYVNAQEVGRTNAAGNVLAPSLISHFGTHVTISPEDVPLDYDLERDRVIAAPPRRGAAWVEFPARRVHYFRGRVRLLRGGAEVDPSFGDLVVEDGADERVSAIGRGGVFELEGLAPGAHAATILLGGERCELTFEVAPSDALLVDLGVLTCELE